VERNLWAEPWDLNFRCFRSRRRIGRWEFSARLFARMPPGLCRSAGFVRPNQGRQASTRCCPGFRAAAIALPRKHRGNAATGQLRYEADDLTRRENGGWERLVWRCRGDRYANV